METIQEEPNEKQAEKSCSQLPRLALIGTPDDGSPPEQVKIAALTIKLNIRLRSADMPLPMQERALRYTRSFVDDCSSTTRRLNPTIIARALKKEFDAMYGPAWHCVVGKSFGSFVTHSPGGFLYFSLDSLFFLLFKTEVHLVADSTCPP